MERQQKILNSLKQYPRASRQERRAVTDNVLAAIKEAGIEGHIGFDIRGKYDTAITFESPAEIPQDKMDNLRAILSRRFPDKKILSGVAKDEDTVWKSDSKNSGHRKEYTETVWNIHIYIPHDTPDMLGLHEVMTSFEYTHNNHILPLPIGSLILGEPMVVDLTRMPHMLVGGTSGIGKSTLLNNFIISLLYSKAPEELLLVLIDPKRIEFCDYAPLANAKVLYEPDEVMGALDAISTEMNRRYEAFRAAGCKDIQEFNGPMPYIVVVIDEYADLLLTCGEEFERAVCRLAQQSRAAGIHIIMATGRPNNDVVTPRIKANFPGRIALRVNSAEESETILDEPGAEDLEHPGDVIFPFNGCTYDDINAPFVTPEEIKATVNSLSQNQHER